MAGARVVAEPTADTAVGLPAAPLAGLVRRYTGYRYAGFPPGRHLGLPSRHLTVVLSLGEPVEIAEMPDPAQPPARFTTLAGGLAARRAVIAHDGRPFGVHLDLTPAGARLLLGLPAGALGGAVVSLEDLLGRAAGELLDRLAGTPSWAGRFAVLDAVLVGLAATCRAAPVPAELAEAWRRIGCSGGTARIGELAGEVGWSRRHLTERFTREYGLTPKQAGRVVRFERSRWMLAARPGGSLAAVAARCGYYDQSHLAREWADLAGCPPSRWLADEELPSVQDQTRGDRAG